MYCNTTYIHSREDGSIYHSDYWSEGNTEYIFSVEKDEDSDTMFIHPDMDNKIVYYIADDESDYRYPEIILSDVNKIVVTNENVIKLIERLNDMLNMETKECDPYELVEVVDILNLHTDNIHNSAIAYFNELGSHDIQMIPKSVN